eukprot:2358850-Pyramimonas_sp.AAC.1
MGGRTGWGRAAQLFPCKARAEAPFLPEVPSPRQRHVTAGERLIARSSVDGGCHRRPDVPELAARPLRRGRRRGDSP